MLVLVVRLEEEQRKLFRAQCWPSLQDGQGIHPDRAFPRSLALDLSGKLVREDISLSLECRCLYCSHIVLKLGAYRMYVHRVSRCQYAL